MSVDTPRCRRPRPVTALVTVLCILGLTGLGGGVEMLVSPRGGTYLPPERLDDIPLVDTYIVPGLVLAIVFGVMGTPATAVLSLIATVRRASSCSMTSGCGEGHGCRCMAKNAAMRRRASRAETS